MIIDKTRNDHWIGDQDSSTGIEVSIILTTDLAYSTLPYLKAVSHPDWK